MVNDAVAFEYRAKGTTAGKGFGDTISYNPYTNLLSVSLIADSLFDPDNPTSKPKNTTIKSNYPRQI
jgi:hypothetical protein